MSYSAKPRYGSAAAAASATTRRGGSAIMTGDDNDNDDEDDITEKSGKIRRTEKLQIRYIICMISMLTVLALIFGNKTAKHHLLKKEDAGVDSGLSKELEEEQLVRRVKSLDEKVRDHKGKPGMIMEVDPIGLELIKELQHWTFKLLVHRYGHRTFRVVLDLEFPETIPDFAEKGPTGQVTFQMAPISLIPCSVFNFLEIARTWKSGAFHRNAGHVLQASARSEVKRSLPFQEYSPEHPHTKGTTGYAGRPSGPGFYISILDNTNNHGPGSQQKANPHEADANFGEVVRGFDDVVPRIHSVPEEGWLSKKNQIKITNMTILYEDDHGKWIPWEKDSCTPCETAQSS
eukprot:scaffold4166_cov95-Cylindrotheca_fusiformis.AAC.3